MNHGQNEVDRGWEGRWMNPGSPANQRLYFCCLKHSLQSSVPFATVRRKGLELPLQPRDIRRELRGIEEQQENIMRRVGQTIPLENCVGDLTNLDRLFRDLEDFGLVE